MKDINLMPREYIVQSQRKKLSVLFLGIGVIFIISVVVAAAIPYQKINERKKILADLNTQKADPKYDIIDQVNLELSQKQHEYKLVEKFVEEVDQESIVSRKTLDVMMGLLPPGMYIQKLSADNSGKTMTIEGDATSQESISEYMIQLANLPYTKEVYFDSSTREFSKDLSGKKYEIISYKINLKMEDEKGAVDKNEEARSE